MGKLIRFEIKDQPKVLVIGKEIRHSMEAQMRGENPLPAFWDQCLASDAFTPLEKQIAFVHDDAYVGVMVDWERGDGCFSYVVGMLMKEGAVVPEGCTVHALEPAKVGVGWIQGKDVVDVCSTGHTLTRQAIEEAGHKYDHLKWCMELYNCPRFTTPDENGEIVLDYYIPIDD